MARITVRENSNNEFTSRSALLAQPTKRETELSRVDELLPASTKIPTSLSGRYRIIEPLTSGGEANLFVVEALESHQRAVLKLYREGFRPNSELLDRIRQSSPDHVVTLFEHGEDAGRYYVVLEFSEHGTLRTLMDSERPASRELCLDILREIASALAHVHSPDEGRYIIHRDIKPENILIKQSEPLDLVLIDFGISELAQGPLHDVLRHATVPYSAPENQSGLIGPESDYWSLGILLLELLSGRHPFTGFDENYIRMQLATDWRPSLSSIDDRRWANLIQGLLCRNRHRRWGAEEIGRWLNGEEVPVYEPAEPQATVEPFRIGENRCHSVGQLVTVMALHWRQATELLDNGSVYEWLANELQNDEASSVARDIALRQSLTSDMRLLHFIYALEPKLPAIWKGQVLNSGGMTELCDKAINGNTDARNLVAEIYQQNILSVIGELTGQTWLQDAGQRWRKALDDYEQSWEIVTSHKGPVGARLPLQDVLPDLYLTACNTIRAGEIRNRLKMRAAEIAFCCPWLSALGTPVETLPPGRLVAAKSIVAASAGLYPDNYSTHTKRGERVEAEVVSQLGEMPPAVNFSALPVDLYFSVCKNDILVDRSLRLDWSVEGASDIRIKELSRSSFLVGAIRSLAAGISVLGLASVLTLATSGMASDGGMIAFMGMVLFIIAVLIWVAGTAGSRSLELSGHRELPLARGMQFTLIATGAEGQKTVCRTPWFDSWQVEPADPVELHSGIKKLADPLKLCTSLGEDDLRQPAVKLRSALKLKEALKLKPSIEQTQRISGGFFSWLNNGSRR